MLHWIAHLILSLNYLGVVILMAIENVVLPLPSELIMPLAGFSASRGNMTLWGAILAGVIGAVIGILPLYVAARTLGEERTARWIDRHGRWLFLRAEDLKTADRRFQRHGGWAVFLSKLIPGVRALIALPAGFARMNVPLFLLANIAGTIIWCAVLAILGDVLGANYKKVHEILGPVTWVIAGSLLLGITIWLIRRRRASGE